MKKYLMIGCAALAFASCSHEVDTYTPEEVAKADYNAKFVSEFGQPNPSHTWGFGAEGTRAFTRTENANANEWADPNKAYGGLKVPPALTDDQIAVVKAYFQSVKDIPYNDPHWTNFFMQQVYKGHSAPKTGTNPAYNEPYSPEAYMAANGTTELYASDYMDHLAAIDEENNFFDHINNFNHGDCGLNNKVLDNGGNANDGPFHSDKIMYMYNSTTKSFGYFNSNGSLCHTEYTGLVSWTVIRDWANSHNMNGNCLDDTWNRSFMGFDFEQMIEGQCYASDNEQWDYSTNPATFISSTPKNLTIWGEYYINGEKQTNYVYQYNGEPVKLLSDQMNRYCADVINVTDGELYSDMRDENNNNAYLGKKLNTDVIDGLLADGYLPVDNKSLRVWAKVGGCADGYFSDWIVTLTEAKPNINYDGRIMAEDLTVQSKSDWDFNDVVFDYKINSDGTVNILLQAAGGTLPLSIGGSLNSDNTPILDEAGNVANSYEVHALFVVDIKTMVNTGDGVNKSAVSFKLTDKDYTSNDQILICVKKKVNGVEEWIPITAYQGQPAAKFVTNSDVNWVDEHANILGAYPEFQNYVQNGTGRFVPTEKNDLYFDRIMRNE
jgi:hypothetical protein